jgi:mannan endo-1,4-beta-mannosidase
VVSGSGVSVKSDISGFEGTGFVGSFETNGDRLSVSFPGVAAGTYSLRIRYHAWTDQQNNVIVNGALRSEPFPATGASNWTVKTIAGVPLIGGTNTVELTKDWGWIHVDWIEIAP